MNEKKTIEITPKEGLVALTSLFVVADYSKYIHSDIKEAYNSLFDKLRKNESVKEKLKEIDEIKKTKGDD